MFDAVLFCGGQAFVILFGIKLNKMQEAFFTPEIYSFFSFRSNLPVYQYYDDTTKFQRPDVCVLTVYTLYSELIEFQP
jgi:hypothetical protein